MGRRRCSVDIEAKVRQQQLLEVSTLARRHPPTICAWHHKHTIPNSFPRTKEHTGPGWAAMTEGPALVGIGKDRHLPTH